MDIKRFKAKLFEMLVSGRDIQYVIDECSVILGNPFVLGNQSLQLMGKSSSCEKYPDAFGWIEDQFGENLKFAKEAEEAGYFDKIYSGDAPVYGKLSELSANWVAARMRIKQHVFGCILVADVQTSFSEEYEKLLPLVCQTIAFALQQSGKKEYSAQNYAALLVELLDESIDNLPDEEAIRKQFRQIGHSFPKKMRLLILRSASQEYMINKMVLDVKLSSLFPRSLGMIYKNDCVRIIDAEITLDTIEMCIRKELQSEHAIGGISRSFSSIFSMKDAYLQADAAIRLKPVENKTFLQRFDAVAGLYLLEQVEYAHNISVKGMIMPEIFDLYSRGDNESLERICDLAAYLSTGRNVTKTAELRNVHKNSMYYRLNKIVNITGLDLDDDDVCVQVMLSLSLLGFLPFSIREK